MNIFIKRFAVLTSSPSTLTDVLGCPVMNGVMHDNTQYAYLYAYLANMNGSDTSLFATRICTFK